jgi:hypothetical protein
LIKIITIDKLIDIYIDKMANVMKDENTTIINNYITANEALNPSSQKHFKLNFIKNVIKT